MTRKISGGGDELTHRLQGLTGGTIADLACGQGGFGQFLLTHMTGTHRVVGVDPRPQLEKPFLDLLGDAGVFVARDAFDYLAAGPEVTTIGLSFALHHLSEPRALMEKSLDVLPSGGTLIVREMYSHPLTPAQESHHLIHSLAMAVDTLTGEIHFSPGSRSELLDLMQDFAASRSDCSEYSVYEVADSGDAEIPSDEDLSVMRAQYSRLVERSPQESLPDMNRALDAAMDSIAHNGIASPPYCVFILVKK